ncbi:MAG: TolC family protein [Candidatus Omnitrophica bacterium]|nr:TolC family protein [Candidatus Omnitrophota bacterium]
MWRYSVGILLLVMLAVPAFSAETSGPVKKQGSVRPLVLAGSQAATLAVDRVAMPAAAEGKVALKDFLEEALKNNPRLKAAQYRAAAARARVGIFRYIPDPELEYEYDKITPAAIGMGGGKVRPMKTIAVSQEIPFPTKIFMRQKSAQREANALEQEYKEVERTVIKEVKEAYAKLYLNRRKAAYLKDTLSLMSQFVEVTNKKYAVSKAGQQDVLRAQVEYSRLYNSVVLYEQEARIAGDWLVSLLGRQDGVGIDISDPEPMSDLNLQEADIVALAKKGRPELKSVRERLEKARADSALSKQEFLPDVTLKYKREEVDGKFSRLDQGQWAGSIGINVPLWFWGKQLAGVREAQADFAAAQADYAAAENAAVFEAKSAFARYEAARQLVEVYETGILPQANAAVNTARRAYAAGTMSFTDTIDAMRSLRDLQMEYFAAVAELQVTKADLERMVGGDLDI